MMPLASFGNLLGGPDLIVILLIVLVLFGAKKLPELARGLGQSLNEFKKAREDVEHEIRQGQQDVQAREMPNRQPYNPAPSTQALPYSAPGATTAAASVPSEQALQQQIADLQEKLRLAEEEKKNTPSSVV